jgi:hypothetical protein
MGPDRNTFCLKCFRLKEEDTECPLMVIPRVIQLSCTSIRIFESQATLVWVMTKVTDMPNTDVPKLIPALVAFLHPFTIVLEDDEEEWETNIEEINTHSYDYVRLHRITGGIDVGLPAPYHMLVGYDGALALPPIENLLSVSKAVEFFNRRLAELLVGGIYCEAVSPEDLDTASILDWKYIRIHGQTRGFVGQYHLTIRLWDIVKCCGLGSIGGVCQ